MDTRNVDSSAISRVGFDHDTGVLVVQFTQGDLYYYWPVDQGTFHDLINADSKGKFVEGEIVQNSEWVKNMLNNREAINPPNNPNMHYMFRKSRDVESYDELREYLDN